MTLSVAIASEYDAYDGEIYRFLISQLLERDVERWAGEFSFNGNRSVVKLAPAFLEAASRHGIRHALLAVDNDGGSRRRPEHEESHVSPPFDIDDNDGCRECWLRAAIPCKWQQSGGLSCVVVPVQVLETWLLCARGDEFPGTPEQSYDRRSLKARFFGKPVPPVSARISMALEALRHGGALEVLRTRPSFARFEERVLDWAVAC